MRVKNQIVSIMLDADFTLIADTQYKLTFAKSVNFEFVGETGKKSQPTPGMLEVPFTVVLEREKTRVSVFCRITSGDDYLAWHGQRKYDAWLNGFFPKLVAKIEGGTPSPSGTAP
jgi:hypothetical protein